MQRHEEDAVVALVDRVDVGDQCDLLEEAGERRVLLGVLVLDRLGNELVDVVEPRVRLLGVFIFQGIRVAGRLDDLLDQLGHLRVLGLRPEHRDEVGKCTDLLCGGRREIRNTSRRTHRVIK